MIGSGVPHGSSIYMASEDNTVPVARRRGPAARRRLAIAEACLIQRVVWLFLLASLSGVSALADERFDIRSAATQLQNGVYYLTARIDLPLSDEALEALESGLELTIQMQIEVFRQRRFLPDPEIANLRQDYVLSYQPLSQRYLVSNRNSGDQSSHATLFAALNKLGRISALPVIDEALLGNDSRYEIRLRVVLDQNTLPGPLRLLAFWGNSFRLQSEWYAWMLKG